MSACWLASDSNVPWSRLQYDAARKLPVLQKKN